MARISKRQKRKQFNALIKLHKKLVAGYTDSEIYTLGQIKTVFENSNIPRKFLPYAIALYCSKADFLKFYKLPDFSDEYMHNRIDVCEMHFYGDSALGWTEGVTRDWPRTRKYGQTHVPLHIGSYTGGDNWGL